MRTSTVSLNDRLFMALTALVMLAPLPLASNRPWSWSLLSFLAALLTVFWGAGLLWGRLHPGLPLRKLALPAMLFLLALLWGWLQTLPIFPPSWSHPIWREAADALRQPLPEVISGDPEKTRQAIMRLLAYGLIFVLGTQLGRQNHRAAQSVLAVAGATLLYGAYALTGHLLGIDYILWLPKWAYIGDATGTFVGHAAFGAFAGIGMLACLALAIQGAAFRLPTIGAGDRIERLLARTVPWLVAATFLLATVLASHSRGALLSTLVACLVLIISAAVGRQLRLRHMVVLLALLVALSVTAILLNGDVTLARMSGEGDLTGDRPNLLRLTWTAITDAPFTGHGLGAFEQTFYPYRDTSLPRAVIYDYAHSTWAEGIMDLGWPAGLCLISSIVITVLVCATGIMRRRQNQIYPALALATAVLLGLQATFDFTVQIPALAALLSYVLGIGYSQSWPTRVQS